MISNWQAIAGRRTRMSASGCAAGVAVIRRHQARRVNDARLGAAAGRERSNIGRFVFANASLRSCGCQGVIYDIRHRTSMTPPVVTVQKPDSPHTTPCWTSTAFGRPEICCPAIDRPVLAVGWQDPVDRRGVARGRRGAGVHGRRTLHGARLDGVDAGLSIRIDAPAVRRDRRRARSSSWAGRARSSGWRRT